jgi:hypothetical protein
LRLFVQSCPSLSTITPPTAVDRFPDLDLFSPPLVDRSQGFSALSTYGYHTAGALIEPSCREAY